MIQKRRGIVVRAQSVHKKVIVLLDEHLGKIEGITFKGFCHGALLEYSVKKAGVRYFINDIQLLDMPFSWARENLLFFHHVLELYNYFIPWDMASDELFHLILFLYTHPEKVESIAAQKAFLYAFFKLVGVHPEEDGKSIEQWIKECIAEHPHVRSFKTTGYLKLLEGV